MTVFFLASFVNSCPIGRLREVEFSEPKYKSSVFFGMANNRSTENADKICEPSGHEFEVITEQPVAETVSLFGLQLHRALIQIIQE